MAHDSQVVHSNPMVSCHSYRTFGGETRVIICHSPHGTQATNGAPGTRTTMLNESEARALLVELQVALDICPDDEQACPAATHGPRNSTCTCEDARDE
jgi:hypothetical protein